jgi:hypothetical protein
MGLLLTWSAELSRSRRQRIGSVACAKMVWLIGRSLLLFVAAEWCEKVSLASNMYCGRDFWLYGKRLPAIRQAGPDEWTGAYLLARFGRQDRVPGTSRRMLST